MDSSLVTDGGGHGGAVKVSGINPQTQRTSAWVELVFGCSANVAELLS